MTEMQLGRFLHSHTFALLVVGRSLRNYPHLGAYLRTAGDIPGALEFATSLVDSRLRDFAK
jgi:hypothetical protein